MLVYDPETEVRTLETVARFIEAKAEAVETSMEGALYDSEDRTLIVGTYRSAATLVRSLKKREPSNVVQLDRAALVAEARQANERANEKDKELVALREKVARLESTLGIWDGKLEIEAPRFLGPIEILLGATRDKKIFTRSRWLDSEGKEVTSFDVAPNEVTALGRAFVKAYSLGFRV